MQRWSNVVCPFLHSFGLLLSIQTPKNSVYVWHTIYYDVFILWYWETPLCLDFHLPKGWGPQNWLKLHWILLLVFHSKLGILSTLSKQFISDLWTPSTLIHTAVMHLKFLDLECWRPAILGLLDILQPSSPKGSIFQDRYHAWW